MDDGGSLDASAGPGIALGPLVLSASLSSGVGFRRGRVWQVGSKPALDALLARLHGDGGAPPPTWRYDAGDRHGSAGASATLDGEGPQLEAGSVRQALGRRTGPDGTTWYFDLGASADGPLASAIPALRAGGRVLAEVRAGTLTLRRVTDDGDRVVSRVARLPLSDPGDRALVRRFVLWQAAGAAGYAAGVALAHAVAARGTVEVDTYTRDTSGGGHQFGFGAFVYDNARTTTSLRLVSAVVGGARRADCLGLG
jgi:hypothetical protein